jgi:glutathione S-transferase
MYAPVVHRFRTYLIDVSQAVRAYMETMMGLPAFAEWSEAGLAEKLVIERVETI